ncbi:MAG: translational activator of GCN4 [Bogoriella megaspora]|nr:MAG: translational activator of GCN4 [Bogoriella megaspora]
MAQNGVHEFDSLQDALASSSTKWRIAELHSLREKLLTREPKDVSSILRLLFQTYAYYRDRDSRRAVQQCLRAIASEEGYDKELKDFAAILKKEAEKATIAPTNAFVLAEWFSVLLQQLAESAQKRAWYLELVTADARTLDICLGSTAKPSIKHGVVVVTRRGLRKLFKSEAYGASAAKEIITTLSAKSASSTAGNTLMLGIVAGVASRIPVVKVAVEEQKKAYYSFYVRELLGSRVPLPAHVSDGLRDFFSEYTTLQDVTVEILPALEKAMLRAPEVVLNNIIACMVNALDPGLDLSQALQESLLKPLLSNTKSTNAIIRDGALKTFEVLASRSKDDFRVEKVATELLTPLKQGKVTSVDQRILYSQMLFALPGNKTLAVKIPSDLATLSLKEANEAALFAETSALAHHVETGISLGLAPTPQISDIFVKGLAESRTNARRIWSLRVGEILWNVSIPRERSMPEIAAAFAAATLPKMVDSWRDVMNNPLPALQSGLVTTAFILTTFSFWPLPEENSARSIIKKTSIAERCLAVDPKPSFLLNPRVYTKLSGEDDFLWCSRALAAVGTNLPEHDTSPSISNAWAQAFLFTMVASVSPHSARRAALDMLWELYQANPSKNGWSVISGIWQWVRSLETGEKDAPSTLAKTGADRLHFVIDTICFSKDQQVERGIQEEKVQDTLIQLLVLCRPELIPRSNWIDVCLKVGQDPGALVEASPGRCLEQILEHTGSQSSTPLITQAAHNAAAELAFVAPVTMIPLLVEQFKQDLDPTGLKTVGPNEAAIYRTSEGTAFIDVLASKMQNMSLDKSAKDYDTMKWEQELRAQLAAKKGQTKKLTSDEQKKVNEQLAKESKIRASVAAIEARARRGIGIIRGLALGPPTEAEAWIGEAVKCLLNAIASGAGLIVGEAAVLAYLALAERISPRLGMTRPFVGVATLRALGTGQLPSNLTGESLADVVTRVMYRLRFMAEQRPFDTVTLAYILPLAFEVLKQGGIEKPAGEEADEQIMLALELLSFHTDTCAELRFSRDEMLSLLVSAMQKYPQHYRIVRDCIVDLCRSIAANITPEETAVLLRGSIVPEVSVRTCVLQAIDAELDLTYLDFSEEIWLACHDDVPENVELAKSIWEENALESFDEGQEAKSSANVEKILPYLESKDRQLRRAAARSIADLVNQESTLFTIVIKSLENTYVERAKEKKPERDKFGMIKKTDLSDPWETRDGIALTFKELSASFPPESIVPFTEFLVHNGPLGDRNDYVRDQMVDAASQIISEKAQSSVEELMTLFESTLEAPDSGSQFQDQVNEAVIILYGAVARHLTPGDPKLPQVVKRLLATLSTPSETVQYAVSQCLQPLIRSSGSELSEYVQQMMDQLLASKKFAERRGAAYGLAGIVRGRGIFVLRDFRIISTLRGATEEKKDVNRRQGAFLAFELFSHILGRLFEPYAIYVVPQLLAGFGDPSTEVRDACLDAAKTCFSSLSSYGVKQILPTLLEGLDEQQWRSKKGACDSLGAMAYLDPQQLALSLPEIIPPLTGVLNDSHKEVRASANRSLKRFGEVITNPEIKGLVDILLKALSDPTKYTDDALDALLKVSFIHYLDAPSLALVVRILERGLGDRSATKRKSAQIIGSLAHLTERKDLISHLPILVAGLRTAAVDPVPTTRATASKALGSLVEKLGEDALPDLIPSLMSTLKSDTGAGDRLGSAQALSEVLAGLGTTRLEETLPTILQNAQSSKPAIREGFMSLFIFLPACFGNSFANYLSRIIPPILGGLADDIESIRETSLRAGRLLVKNFATRAIDLLLPELERGMGDDSHRIRLSSVELVGDLLFNLTGISAKKDEDEAEESATEAGQSLLEVLGEERRNRVLSILYICRCDTSGLVRTAAINVWKALVASPRTLRELIPTLTQVIIRRLGSSNMEQKVIAGNALGELIRKAGEGVLNTLLPTLEDGLQTSVDADAKQGICIALRELIASASPDTLEDHEKTLISVVRTALGDTDDEVRDAAAEAFDALQQVFGKKAVDQVLPHMLTMLRSEDEAENALAALLTLLTDNTRSNIILPNLLPTLLKQPISAFNARALASLAEVAGGAMNRRLPNILNGLMDSIIASKDSELRTELDNSFDAIILSVDEFDGLNTMISVMQQLAKHDDHRRRASADLHFAKFFSEAEQDFSRYYPDLIRTLLISFDDRDAEVVKAAHAGLTALTSRLKKEEMESLVNSTRQVLQQVGVAGANLPGFSLPKGINAVLPIFIQGLMNGSAEQRTQAALALSDVIDRTSPDALKPAVTTITGPLIRVVSERSVDLRAAILFTLNKLLEKIPAFLKAFLPQLQRTFAKSLADTSSDLLRQRAAQALGTLITLTPRVDPLIAELVTGSKTSDAGVKNAMINALYQVVSKAGGNMNEASRSSILGLIDMEIPDDDDNMAIANARLLGALVKVLPPETANPLVKSRALTSNFTKSSVFALNSILLEAPSALTSPFAEETPSIICRGISTNKSTISEACVLAAGKFLLTPSAPTAPHLVNPLLSTLANAIPPGNPIDVRRLSLVVLRTLCRSPHAISQNLISGNLSILAPAVFSSVRDGIIPVKLAAEAAFLAIFEFVDKESVVFDEYLSTGAGKDLPPQQKRAMADYAKRVTVRLAAQARERKEAEGGMGGLGLSEDEREDEREVWSVGRVDLGEGAGFGD